MKIALVVVCLLCSLTAWGQEQAKSALADLIRSAEQGKADAQLILGMRYDIGRGVPQDYAVAVKWYRLAAEQGHVGAQVNLGAMYYRGQGVPQDYAEAARWYRLAAEQGNAAAQQYIDTMYARGQGVPKDDAMAVKSYRLRLAAEQGNAPAQHALGVMYHNGQGVMKDDGEAVKWFRLAAEQGNADAQSNLGAMYSYGQGVWQDYAEAAKWYRLAAEQGDASTQNSLGMRYDNGQGIPTDYAEAGKWFRLAAEQGNASAQFNLGSMYHDGRGRISRNYVQAHKWVNLAASRATGDDQERYADARERIAAKMTPQQIAEAQRLARGWKPKTWDDLQRTSAGERLRSVQPTEESRLAPGQTTLAEISGVRMEFVSIPPGEFEMGCSRWDGACQEDEKPRHRVRITKEFEMCKYEVTQAQWEAVMGSNPSEFEGTGRPVESVSWNDVQEFLGKLNERGDKYYYRLPTEAEWEYAARAGNKGSGTQDPDAVGWYRDNSANRTHEVGQKEPNSFGLYDMQGNVWEWVEDWYWYGENFYRYRDHLQTDPKGPSSGNRKVVRGGSWDSSARHMSFSDRGWFDLPTRFDTCGFRCVRERRR